MIPGEIIVAAGDIILNEGREAITLTVANTGDRPVQIGSHYHFAEANAALEFDRNGAAECGLILRQERQCGLNPDRHAMYSLCRLRARDGCLVLMHRSWETFKCLRKFPVASMPICMGQPLAIGCVWLILI